MNEIIDRIKATDERKLSSDYLAELDARMRAACNPEADTAAMRQAIADWNRENGYNGKIVPYLDMTSDQRADVIRRSNIIKAGK